LPRFVAVHTMPFTEEQLTEFAKGIIPKIPPGVSWNRTYCDFADGKFFCDWEAPNKETIEQAFKANNVPFDVVYPVRLFDIAKAELEP